MTEAKQATPHSQLISELMDSRVPKTEREHAAAREIGRLRAALEQPEQEPVAMLWKIRKALALASAICDRVPTRWHYTHEIGSAEADIGDMVNAHPDGTHGYRLIQEAEAELVAYLTTPEAAPPRREWQSLTDAEIAAALPHEPGDLDFVCARAAIAKAEGK